MIDYIVAFVISMIIFGLIILATRQPILISQNKSLVRKGKNRHR